LQLIHDHGPDWAESTWWWLIIGALVLALLLRLLV